MLQKQCGFSLIEVMIVIAIIAILVAMALPSYQKYTRRAHYMEIIQSAAPLKIAVVECYEITGNINKCQSNTHSIPKSRFNLTNSLVNSIEVLKGGIIHISPNNKYGISTSDDYFLTPKISQDVIIWKSSGGGVSVGYAH